MMKGIWSLLAATLMAQSSTSLAQTDRFSAELTRSARQYVKAGKSDGISIAAIRCGRSTFVTAGVADRARRTPVTPDTIFEIGSLSKTFTALLLAHALVERRAGIDDDVRRYLPGEYRNLEWSDGKPITLGELADTTSGLPDYLPDPASLAKLPAEQQLPAASRLLAGYSNADFLKDLHGIKLVSRPGSAARHSNVAAQLLGYVVGRLYGTSFDALLAEKVERPGGLSSRSNDAAKSATGYSGAGAIAPPFDGESIRPAGGLRYSGRDMARFLNLQVRSDDRAVSLSHRTRVEEAPDRHLAFTWVISPASTGPAKFRMSGGTFGSSSYVEFYPALRYGIAVMANRASGDAQDELQKLAERTFRDAGRLLSECQATRRENRIPLASAKRGFVSFPKIDPNRDRGA